MGENYNWSLSIPFLAPVDTINNIKFSPREVDIFACILGGRATKKIASLLSLSPKTVENYIRNITLKLECSSRESIIDFAERSDKLHILKDHYTNLLIQAEFEKNLKEISGLIGKKTFDCLLKYGEEYDFNFSLIPLLEKHLKLVGLTVILEPQSELTLFSEGILELCIEEKSVHTAASSLRVAFFLFLERDDLKDTPKQFSKLSNVEILKGRNYYYLFFGLLKMLYPQLNPERIVSNFKEKYENMIRSHKNLPCQVSSDEQKQESYVPYEMRNFLQKRKWFLLSATLMAGLFSIGIFTMTRGKQFKFASSLSRTNQEVRSIRSDLILPTEALLLNRPKLIAQIEEKLKGQGGIQTVALIGVGGAGKTTLARYYAHSQPAAVIWEFNAETRESLKGSFEDLAYALAKTEEDKKALQDLQNIKNSEKRESQILLFVKEHLRNSQKWVLIYDNVGRFGDIKKYFPQDPGTWGRGKVILTTQDSNIENNKYVNYAIPIHILNAQQKLDLFTKIMGHGDARPITVAQSEENKKFLESIPSFPLDVSIAAYYLKINNISHQNYLESLKNNDKTFIEMQENILKDSGDYIKTRYSIVTLALKNLIDKNKEFEGLLLLISLLDSQNISRELLAQYKNKSIVDSFIYHLKQYSLVTSESQVSPSDLAFSLHRSTHAIILEYLTKVLNEEKRQNLISSIGNTFANYIDKIIFKNIKRGSNVLINKEDWAEMKLLARHCTTFLSHSKLVPSRLAADIQAKLGDIFYYMGDYIKAKKFLENSLTDLEKDHNENPKKVSHILMYLGDINMELGHYETARALLNKALTAYENFLSGNPTDTAQTLSFIGPIYTHLGDYQKAKALLERSFIIYKRDVNDPVGYAQALGAIGYTYWNLGEYTKAIEALEQSLFMHRKEFARSPINFAWVLIYLGNAYGSLGEYDKAKDFLQEGVQIYEAYFPLNHVNIAWAKIFLGNAYMNLGQYEKAKKLIEEALRIYNNLFEEDNVRTAYAFACLGNVYKQIKNYEKSKKFLEKSLSIYAKTFGENHIKANRVLRDLGQVYLLKGHLEKAEELLRKSLKVFEQNNHTELYTLFENLAELYEKKSVQAKKLGDTQQSQHFKNQALNYLKQAHEIIKKHFAPNSPHLIRVQENLQKLAQS